MVDIECTRCGAKESGFETIYTANFGLTHQRGCGTKIGISKYSNTGKTVKKTETSDFKKVTGMSNAKLVVDEAKPKKSKKKKKKT